MADPPHLAFSSGAVDLMQGYHRMDTEEDARRFADSLMRKYADPPYEPLELSDSDKEYVRMWREIEEYLLRGGY